MMPSRTFIYCGRIKKPTLIFDTLNQRKIQQTSHRGLPRPSTVWAPVVKSILPNSASVLRNGSRTHASRLSHKNNKSFLSLFLTSHSPTSGSFFIPKLMEFVILLHIHTQPFPLRTCFYKILAHGCDSPQRFLSLVFVTLCGLTKNVM